MDVPSATVFSSTSYRRGMAIITIAPMIGTKIAAESTQWSSPFITLLREGDQGCADDNEGAEEDGGIVLHTTGLGGAETGPGFLRSQTSTVHGAVDDPLVDDVVREITHRTRTDAKGIDDGVDDVLVDPVGAFRDFALDAADDAVGVQVVEVVLVDQQRLTGAVHLVAVREVGQSANSTTAIEV